MALLASYAGIALLAATLRDPGLISAEGGGDVMGPGDGGRAQQASSLEEVQAHMGRLPFVALSLLTFEYTELIEL